MGEKSTGSGIITRLCVSPREYDHSAFRNSKKNSGAFSGMDRDKLLAEFSEWEKGGFYSSGIVPFIALMTEEAVVGGTDPEKAFGMLLELYDFYKERNNIFYTLIGEWLCDLYLVTGREDQLSVLVGHKAFEVFLVSDHAVGEYINAFLKKDTELCRSNMNDAIGYLSEYDHTRSVYYQKNKKIYHKAINAVIPKVFSALLAERGRGFFVPEEKSARRSVFCGLPCESGCSKIIEITYIPYSENNELRAFATAVVKHIDNLIRQGLGVKSKVMGFTLATEYRRICSDAIREAIPDFLPMPAKVGRKPSPEKAKTKRAADGIPEQKSEPIELNIDFTKAKKLEAESWKIAEIFGADYGTNDITFNVQEIYSEKNGQGSEKATAVSESSIKQVDTANIPEDWRELFACLEEAEKQFLCALSKGLDITAFAKKRGGMADGYIDGINEKAQDTYGDIIIEDFDFIEDYRSELEEIFSQLYDTEVL